MSDRAARRRAEREANAKPVPDQDSARENGSRAERRHFVTVTGKVINVPVTHSYMRTLPGRF